MSEFPTVNMDLVKELGITYEKVSKIAELHVKRIDIFNRMEALNPEKDYDQLRELAGLLPEIEYQLQALWGFPCDSRYHKWFTVPHCTCPKHDNLDRIGTGHFIINKDCPIHGE
jgi:hypothetical protein